VILLNCYLALLYYEAKALAILSEQSSQLKNYLNSHPSHAEQQKLNDTINKIIALLKPLIKPDLNKDIFSDQELYLLKLLGAEGPIDKFQIMSHLFGPEVEVLVAENRIKNLLFRIRTKAPQTIYFKNGKYHLKEGF
jgi:hypothetical protein